MPDDRQLGLEQIGQFLRFIGYSTVGLRHELLDLGRHLVLQVLNGVFISVERTEEVRGQAERAAWNAGVLDQLER